MEILGLVWAASIINHSPPMTPSLEVGEHGFKHQESLPIEETVSWFSSLAQAYGWDPINLEPTPAYSSYASTASWLVPTLTSLASAFENTESTAMGMEFSPLSPVIGTGLSSIEPPVEEGLQPPGSEYLASLNQWHSWDAIAAVRITESGAQVTPEDSFSNLDTHQCAADSAAAYQANTAATSPTPKLQVWVHNHFIGEVTGRAAARQLADNLRLLIKQGKLDAAHLQPIFGANFVGGSLHSDILFIVDESLKSHPEVPAAAIAVQWINNLRIAFDESPLDLVQVQMAMKGLIETSQALYGTASWYGPGFHGRQTANGERFDENALTAAHKTLPFNTHLKVTNRLNGKSVVVRINDRGPYIGNRTLDLSRAAARCLGSVGNGVVPYEAVVLESVPKPELEELTTAQLTADIDLGD